MFEVANDVVVHACAHRVVVQAPVGLVVPLVDCVLNGLLLAGKIGKQFSTLHVEILTVRIAVEHWQFIRVIDGASIGVGLSHLCHQRTVSNLWCVTVESTVLVVEVSGIILRSDIWHCCLQELGARLVLGRRGKLDCHGA